MSRTLKSYLATLADPRDLLDPDHERCCAYRPKDPAGPTQTLDVDIGLGLAFWIAVTLVASALPVTMPRGAVVNTSSLIMMALPSGDQFIM